MAFGKSKEVLSNVGSFHLKAVSQQINKAEQRQRRGGGGGGGSGARFNEQFRPTATGQDRIRIIAGSYDNQLAFTELVHGKQETQIITETLPWFNYAEHFNARNKKSTVCSAGPLWMDRNKKQPCIGCDLYWSGRTRGADGKTKTGFMSRRELSALTVLHYAKYYKIEQLDHQTGRAKINPHTQQPYYQWVTANPQNRELIATAREEREGAILHWSLGTSHFNALVEYAKVVANDCTSCGSQCSIQTDVWTCADCGEALIERATTNLDDNEIMKMVSRPMRCSDPQCPGHHEPKMVQEIMTCSGCDNPVRAGIFDVDLTIKLNKSDDPSSKATTLMPLGRSKPGPVKEPYAKLVKPLDLPKIFAPTSIEIQRALFDVPLEREEGDVSRPYTQNKY